MCQPEAALSTQNQLACLRRIDELSAEDAPVEIAWEDAEPVRLTRRFLDDRERFLSALLSD